MKICRECFYEVFEEEIHQVIVENQLFKPGERVAIGASGGKGECLFLSIFYRILVNMLVFLIVCSESDTGEALDFFHTERTEFGHFGPGVT